MSFPRYPNYKDSGLETVSDIPETWTPTRLRFLLQDGYAGLKIGPFGSQLTSDMLVEGGVYKVYGQENVIANDFTRGSRYIDEDKFGELSVYEITPGDLLITMMGTSGRCDVAPSNMAPGIMDSHLLRMRVTPSVRAEFVRLLIDEAAYVGTQIELAGKGSIMHGLNSTIVKNLLLFVPPFEEQAQILTFLDRETAKIDALVAEQRRLMALLKEKRQAVISHAVTRGLNPHAPMKPSGIEWLGEVPEHWVQSRIKYSLRGLIDTEHKTAPFFDDGEYLVVRTTNIKDGKLLLDGGKYTNFDGYEEWTRRGKPVPGDIMFTREAPAGEACLVPEDVQLCMGQRTVLMQIDHDALDSRFALWSLYGGLASEFITILSQGSTVAHFNMSDISNIPIMLPSVGEQTEIAEFLETELAKFDTLTTEAQRGIDLLQERRTALISAAVTGQIDVRRLVPAEIVVDAA